jgi:hypothetical protein
MGSYRLQDGLAARGAVAQAASGLVPEHQAYEAGGQKALASKPHPGGKPRTLEQVGDAYLKR